MSTAAPETVPTDRVIDSLLRISNLVGSVMLLGDILEEIVKVAADLMKTPICTIYLLREDGSLLVRSNLGTPEIKGQTPFVMGKGIPGWVAKTGETVALADATTDERYAAHKLSNLELGCRAYICAPLRIQEDIIGVMSARKRERYTFTHAECRLFETVCKQVSIVVEKSRMYEDKLKAERLAAVAVSMSGVAHYIKNVLFTSRIGERLIDQGLNKEGGDITLARQGWKALQEATGKIRKLVESMLTYCRETNLEFQSVDINAMITDLLAKVQEQAASRQIRIVTQLDSGLGPVRVEPDMVYDALLNLVTNGLDAIPSGRAGTLRVATSRMPGQSSYKIMISDDGVGIPEDIRDEIFNLFFSTKGEGGTGIGLAATRKVIEGHGGAIEFTSAVGVGTEFTIYLPFWGPDEDIPSHT